MESPRNPRHLGSIPPGSLSKPRFLRARIPRVIVDSALYVDGAAGRGPPGARRASRPPASGPTRSSGSASTSRPRRSSTRSGRRSTSTNWPWRTPSRPTSARSSRSTTTRCSSSSRPPATSTPRRPVEFGEILVFVGESFVVHVRHGEATALSAVRRAVEGRGPTCSAAGRAPCCTPSSTRSSTTTARSSPASTTTSARSSSRSSPSGVTTPSSGSTCSSGRCSNSTRRPPRWRRPLDALHSRKFEVIHEDIREYFRDVHDHALRVVEQVEHVLRPA